MPTATATKSTELAPREASPFAIVREDPEIIAEIVAANLGGQVTAGDLDRIKVPGAGGLSWTVPSIDGESEVKELEGIIVHWQDRKAYWAVPLEESGGGSPPDCHSDDGLIGIGKPGGPCKVCSFNQFESALKGKGKACKDIKQVFLVREGDLLPILVSVPASSLLNVRQYLRRLAGQAILYYSCVTRLTLERTKNDGGIVYSEVACSFVRRLEGAELGAARTYHEQIARAAASVPVEGGEPFSD